MSYGLYNQGLNESEKPTSRVIRPPGGGSSISFGGDVPAISSAKPKPTQTPQPKPQALAATSPPKATGTMYTAGTTSNSDGINFGKTNKSVHTSSKVLNPPGGKSSISFF